MPPVVPAFPYAFLKVTEEPLHGSDDLLLMHLRGPIGDHAGLLGTRVELLRTREGPLGTRSRPIRDRVGQVPIRTDFVVTLLVLIGP
jgi:hypothetical protein